MTDEASVAIAELEGIVRRFEPVYLIAALLLFEDDKNQRRLVSGGPEGLLAYVEYAALILSATKEHGSDFPSYSDLHEIIRRIDHVYAVTVDNHKLQHNDKEEDIADSNALARRLTSRLRDSALYLRNPGDPNDWLRLLKSFSEQRELNLETALGISFPQVIGLIEALILQLEARYQQTRHAYVERYTSLHQLFRKGAKAWRKAPTYQRGLLQAVAAATDRDFALRDAAWAFLNNDSPVSDICSIVTIDTDELSNATKFDTTIIQNFIRLFLISPLSDSGIIRPTYRTQLSATPLIFFSGQVICPDPALLVWAALPRLASILNPARASKFSDKRAYHRFQNALATFVEGATYFIIEQVGGEDLELNATYAVTSKEKPEVDVIGRIDRTLIIAECKAVIFSEASLRGGELSLRSDLKDALRSAQLQSERAAKAATETTFQSMRSTSRDYRTSFDDILKLIVLLDNHPVIAAASLDLGETEYLGSEPAVPITLLDFYDVMRYLRTPAIWIDYFKKRSLAIANGYKAMALDEHDLLAQYMYSGQIGAPGHTLFIADATTLLEERREIAIKHPYRFLGVGPRLDALIAIIEGSRRPYWTYVIGQCLSFRIDIERHLEKVVEKISTDGGQSLLVLGNDELHLAIAVYHNIALRDISKYVDYRIGLIQQTSSHTMTILFDPHSRMVDWKWTNLI